MILKFLWIIIKVHKLLLHSLGNEYWSKYAGDGEEEEKQERSLVVYRYVKYTTCIALCYYDIESQVQNSTPCSYYIYTSILTIV